MEQSFFPEEGRWYRGNIHSHTTRTDGLCPPAQQIRDYSEQGYDFLAITDHNVIDSHRLGEGLPICMIPGWERDIRHCSDNTKCIHVVGLVPSRRRRPPAVRPAAAAAWKSRISSFWMRCAPTGSLLCWHTRTGAG